MNFKINKSNDIVTGIGCLTQGIYSFNHPSDNSHCVIIVSSRPRWTESSHTTQSGIWHDCICIAEDGQCFTPFHLNKDELEKWRNVEFTPEQSVTITR